MASAGLGEGSHPYSTVGQVKMAADGTLCVGREGFRDQNEHNYVPSHHYFVLTRCDVKRADLTHFEFELLLQ